MSGAGSGGRRTARRGAREGSAGGDDAMRRGAAGAKGRSLRAGAVRRAEGAGAGMGVPSFESQRSWNKGTGRRLQRTPHVV